MKQNYYVLMMLFMFIALNQWTYAQTTTTVTRNFATDPLWTGSNNIGGNNNYGYKNSEWTPGNTGAIGGIFSRTNNNSYYADTQLNGVFNRTNTLRMKGSFYLNNSNMTGNFYLGYFDASTLNRDKFIGIQFTNPNTTSEPFRGYLRAMGAFTPTPIPLSQHTTLNFDLTWTGNSDGSGTFAGTLAGQSVNLTVAAGSSTPFNAFGLLSVSQTYANTKTDNCYFDDLTYTKYYSTEWNGSAWSNNIPATGRDVLINGNYSDAGFTCNDLTVNAGNNLTLSSGALAVQGNLTLKSTDAGTATFVKSGGTLTVTGSTSVEQYVATTRNWYISSPVTGAVAPSGYTYYQRDEAYNSGAGSWTSQAFVAGNTFAVGKGYIALPGSAASTLTFVGSLNSGDQTISLTKGGTGFNLIGNPYPAHLTWTQAFVDNVTNAALIGPSIWYRTTTGTANNQTGWSFKTINASTGEASPLGTTAIIPPMQAFWVKALAAGDLILNSDLTVSHQSSNPLKAPAAVNADRKRLRLQVTGGEKSDETLLYFDQNASNAYDRFDTPRFEEANTVTQLYSKVGDEKLVINGMQNYTVGSELPLGFNAGQAGTYTISAIQISNFNTDEVKLVLKDNLNSSETDLSTADYQFTSTADDTNRFSVLFRAPGVTTGTTNASNKKVSVFVNAQNQITIQAKAGSPYAIYNATGQLIENGLLNSDSETRSNELVCGVYIVKVNNQSTRIIIKF